MSVFKLRMRVCSSINLSVLLEKPPFNITHSRSEIEWSGLLKCLATGSPLLLLNKNAHCCFNNVMHLLGTLIFVEQKSSIDN